MVGRLSATARLSIRLLGGFEVSVDGRPVDDKRWRLRKARALLKVLALAPGHRLARERAMDVLWPELDPAAADNNLRQAVHVVRRTLDPERDASVRWIVAQDDALALAGDPCIDVDAFVAAAREARASGDLAAYGRALALYTGDLLPDDAYEDWAASRRGELRDMHLGLLMELGRIHERAGRAVDALTTFERVTGLAPCFEEAHVALMRMHARAGDRGRALQQFERLADALRRELDTEPDDRTLRLRADILAGRLAPEPAQAPRRGNLPSHLTTFVGRGREREDAVTRLGQARLVTLTGPGGGGKTRLAIAVAQALLERGTVEAAWFVDLGSVSDPALVPRVVAAAVGGAGSGGSFERAVAELRGRHLVVLDSCEHLVEAAGAVARDLLAHAPHLRVLATSRQSLGLDGEVILDVPPLAVPESEADAAGSEAVRLFVERARLARPGLALTEQTLGAIAGICRRLDGLPLAIELAAALTRGLSLDEIAARLDDRFRLLVGRDRTRPARHQTLRAAIDRSYEQLVEADRLVFERLSAFHGPWTLASAEGVVADGHLPAADVAVRIASLVDRSLVTLEVRDDATVRYRMLETIRDYAKVRLVERGEADTLARRHADHFILLAESAQRASREGAQRSWLPRLYDAGEELRAAFEGVLALRDRERAMRLGAAMVTYYVAVGSLAEGARLLEAALALDGGAPSMLRARLLAGIGSVRRDLGDREEARRAYEEAIAIGRTLGQRAFVATLLSTLGGMLVPHRSPEALPLLEEALALRRLEPDDQALATLLWNMANQARTTGDDARAAALYDEALELARRAGAIRERVMIRHATGTLAHARGDRAGARAAFEECLALARSIDDWWCLVLSLGSLAFLELDEGRPADARILRREALEKAAARQERALIAGLVGDAALAAARSGRFEPALRLLACAMAWHQKAGMALPAMRLRFSDVGIAEARAALGASAARIEAEGARLSLEAATGLVLGSPVL